jgi:hypothetical protein
METRSKLGDVDFWYTVSRSSYVNFAANALFFLLASVSLLAWKGDVDDKAFAAWFAVHVYTFFKELELFSDWHEREGMPHVLIPEWVAYPVVMGVGVLVDFIFTLRAFQALSTKAATSTWVLSSVSLTLLVLTAIRFLFSIVSVRRTNVASFTKPYKG